MFWRCCGEFSTYQHLWPHHCVFSPQNALWLCLGVIAMFSLITVILCVRLAKHLRRAKTGEDIYSEESTSNYGVPLRMFDKFPKLNKKKFSWYVRFIHKSICLFWWIGSWLFMAWLCDRKNSAKLFDDFRKMWLTSSKWKKVSEKSKCARLNDINVETRHSRDTPWASFE